MPPPPFSTFKTVLSGVEHCTAYLDDVVVYTQPWEAHMQIIEHALSLAKCDFVQATVTNLRLKSGTGTGASCRRQDFRHFNMSGSTQQEDAAQVPRDGRVLLQLLP